MSCDFKPGDEVVCVDADGVRDYLALNATYRIRRLDWCASEASAGVHVFGVDLPQRDSDGFRIAGFRTERFRKVERRNDSLSIEVFLTIKPDQFEGPKRAPAKKRERA